MIFDAMGRPVVAYGSPGGLTIINSVFNVTLNLLDHGLTIQEAIDAPRISVTAAGGSVSIDVGNPLAPTPLPAASLGGLRALGHTVNAPADIFSVQMVVIDPKTGRQYAVADGHRPAPAARRPWQRPRRLSVDLAAGQPCPNRTWATRAWPSRSARPTPGRCSAWREGHGRLITTSHLRYSPSGKVSVIGWSGAAPVQA